MPYKQIYVESDEENADSDETIEPEPQPEVNKETAEEEVLSPVKKKKGRPAKTLEEKLAKKTIIKEKLIYMIPNESGGYDKVKNKQLTARDIKKIEEEKKITEMEKELGKKLLRKSNGKLDKRSVGEKTRTPAQIEATKRMLEANKKRREEKGKYKKEENKQIIKDSVREVVNEPFYQPKKPADPYENMRF